MLWHKEHTFKGYPFAYVKQTNVKWNITDAFPNGGDMDKVFPPEQELKDIYHYNGNTYGVRQAMGAGIYLRHVWGIWFLLFMLILRKTTRLMHILGCIRPRIRRWDCGWNSRITVVRKWIWRHCLANGIIREAASGLMVAKYYLLYDCYA